MEIQGYSNYLIYDDGRVWSKRSNKFLKPQNNGTGYYIYTFPNKTNKLIHRLVAEHYIPNPLNKPQVNHEDGTRSNNHVSNLRWVTDIENKNAFKKLVITNTSGHRNIRYDKRRNRWNFQKKLYGKDYSKSFKSKTDIICYKYIFLLRMKANHFKV
tara:strand:- start:45 stop:512 length:468 start_codon:yes stop_codon:yes gene_type:complete